MKIFSYALAGIGGLILVLHLMTKMKYSGIISLDAMDAAALLVAAGVASFLAPKPNLG